MNPLEYFDFLETQQIDKINLDSKEQYTKDEVIKLIDSMAINYRKAIYNGEYIFDIEALDNSHITIKDEEFSVQKLTTHDDKLLLFLQMQNVSSSFSQIDLEIMVEEISKAANKSKNIAGVVLLPPDIEISLITAKLETLSYATDILQFTEEEMKNFNSLKYQSAWSTVRTNTSTNDTYYTYI